MKNTNPSANFHYRELGKFFSLHSYVAHLEVTNNYPLFIPKGVSKISTAIELIPGYMEIIQQDVDPTLVHDYHVNILTYLYVREEEIMLYASADDDVMLSPNICLVRLIPLLAAHG